MTMASGLYVTTFTGALKNTLALDLDSDTHKCALYTNTLTPNFSSDTVYSVTNEVSGTGYVAGGATMTSPTITESPTKTLMFDAADVSWAASTITARGAIVYDSTISNTLVMAVTFGSDFSTTSGTFTITWAVTGLFTIALA